MTTKKQKRRNRIIDIIVFMSISLVLLVNNITDLFTKFGLKVTISWIAWLGLIGMVFYTFWLAYRKKI